MFFEHIFSKITGGARGSRLPAALLTVIVREKRRKNVRQPRPRPRPCPTGAIFARERFRVERLAGRRSRGGANFYSSDEARGDWAGIRGARRWEFSLFRAFSGRFRGKK
jgi:hypothetical protein